jgi:hypothetical protein
VLRTAAAPQPPANTETYPSAFAKWQLGADKFWKWASKYCPDAKYMNVKAIFKFANFSLVALKIGIAFHRFLYLRFESLLCFHIPFLCGIFLSALHVSLGKGARNYGSGLV